MNLEHFTVSKKKIILMLHKSFSSDSVLKDLSASARDMGSYIFEINPLSVASFAIIFSQTEGCLFTLLIVSFAVQKLLSFIRSHLFIFAFVSNILGCGS